MLFMAKTILSKQWINKTVIASLLMLLFSFPFIFEEKKSDVK